MSARRPRGARWSHAVALATLAGLVAAAGCGGGRGLGRSTPTGGTYAHPLALGRPHVIDWGKDGQKVETTPLRVQRGSIADLSRFDLSAKDRKRTPYYVRFRFRNAGTAPLASTDLGGNPHIVLQDAAGKPLQPLLLFNMVSVGKLPCVPARSPANWPAGASLESCTIFLGARDATPAVLAYSVSAVSAAAQARSLVWWKVSVT